MDSQRAPMGSQMGPIVFCLVLQPWLPTHEQLLAAGETAKSAALSAGNAAAAAAAPATTWVPAKTWRSSRWSHLRIFQNMIEFVMCVCFK